MRRPLTTGVFALLALNLFLPASADEADYSVRVIARDLMQPIGITASRDGQSLFFTQVPAPGAQGPNSIARLDLATQQITILHMGDPEPRNIVQNKRGTLYWSCTSAGVIARQTADGTTGPVLTGLQKPIGIAVDTNDDIFYTEVPTPGVGGNSGGRNGVFVFDGVTKTVLNMGEPEPVDIAIAPNGDLYWTCKSAGVILRRSNGETTMFLTDLDHPTGIAIDEQGHTLYFTEVPTPGVGGNSGGRNKVWSVNLMNGERSLVNAGDPEPTDITVGRNGRLYWTCTSANVIVEATPLHVVYVPIAGSVDGANGHRYSTNMRLFNPSMTDSVELSAAYLPVDQDNSAAEEVAITLAPRQSHDIDDMVGTQFGASGIGAIGLRAESPFFATTRIFTDSDCDMQPGGTVGQFVAGQPADAATTAGVLVHLRSDADFRTNIGLFNPHDMSAEVTVRLYGSDDQPIGEPVTLTLPPFGSIPPTSVAALFDVSSLAEPSLWVAFEATRSIFAYASMIDNHSGDQIFVTAGSTAVAP